MMHSKTKTTFTNHQVRAGLAMIAGVELTSERLRQFREGDTERRERKRVGTYERPYAPILQRETDWDWDKGIVYTEEGIRKLFRRYGVRLRAEHLRQLQALPRTARGTHPKSSS